MSKSSFIGMLLGCALAAAAQNAPKFAVDPSWPKPLPAGWIVGQLGGVCVDSHDHIVVVNRRNITDEEKETSQQAPPILMFDTAGTLVKSFGDPDRVPNSIHGCAFDRENNVWVGGNTDGIIQKYDHDGKLLMQIGTRGLVDSTDGTEKGKPLNAAHDRLYNPAGIVVDPDQRRYLCVRRLRQPARGGVRQDRQIPAPVGPPGDRAGGRRRRPQRVFTLRALHQHEPQRAAVCLRPLGRPRRGLRQSKASSCAISGSGPARRSFPIRAARCGGWRFRATRRRNTYT